MAERHTQQVAQQGALAAWLTYAEQLAQRGRRVVLSVYSATTERDLRQPLRDERRRRACKHEALRLRNSKTKLDELTTAFWRASYSCAFQLAQPRWPLRLLAQPRRRSAPRPRRTCAHE